MSDLLICDTVKFIQEKEPTINIFENNGLNQKQFVSKQHK